LFVVPHLLHLDLLLALHDVHVGLLGKKLVLLGHAGAERKKKKKKKSRTR